MARVTMASVPMACVTRMLRPSSRQRPLAAHDTEVAAKAIAAELKRIKPWAGSAA